MKKTLFLIGGIIVLMAIVSYLFIFKDHRNIATEKAIYSKSASAVYQEFSNNDSLANIKYLNKTINVYGVVTEIDTLKNILTLDGKISARFTNKWSTVHLQDAVSIKGRVVGFDDLLEEVHLDQCCFK